MAHNPTTRGSFSSQNSKNKETAKPTDAGTLTRSRSDLGPNYPDETALSAAHGSNQSVVEDPGLTSPPKRKKSLFDKIFPRSIPDELLAITKGADSDGFSDDDTSVPARNRTRTKSEGLIERIRTLRRRIAQEEFDEEREHNASPAEQIAALQLEILNLQSELQTYKADKRELLYMTKGPTMHRHQKADLTYQNFEHFIFKGVIVVLNNLEQAIDSFDIVPDMSILYLPPQYHRSPPNPHSSLRHRRMSSPTPRSLSPTPIDFRSDSPGLGKEHQRSRSVQVEIATIRSRSTVDGLAQPARSNSLGQNMSGAPSSPPQVLVPHPPPVNPVRQTTPLDEQQQSRRTQSPPLLSSALGTSNSTGTLLPAVEGGMQHLVPKITYSIRESNELKLEHVILDLNLVLDSAGALGVIKQPATVSLFFYLRQSPERRYDCLLSVNLDVATIRNEMVDCIKNSGQINVDGNLKQLDSYPSVSLTTLAFEMIEYDHDIEIKTYVSIGIDTEGIAIPVISSFSISIPLSTHNASPTNIITPSPLANMSNGEEKNHESSFVIEPILTTKNIQNFWFRLEIEYGNTVLGELPTVLGPFFPSEQHVNLADSHYYIEQEIPLSGVSVLAWQRKIEKRSPYDTVFNILYYYRDRVEDESSMFCVAALELSVAEIVKCSQGFQKQRDRFKLEKQVELGLVRATFHFFVVEEMIPEPSTTGQAINPLSGNWILERISIGIRVS